jgi:hypothetical protein
MAVKEMVNSVVVEGVLSEIGLERSSYVKDGVKYECIRGDVKVRVVTPIEQGGEPAELEVPIRFFTKKLTNAGNENPAYTNLAEIIDNGKSIAAVGAEAADCVRVTGARIAMQEYYTPDGRFVSFPSVNGSFINIVKSADMEPKAKAEIEMVIQNMKHLTDKEGIETGTLQINGITVGYNEYTDVIPFVTSNPKYVAAIEASYSEGDTMKVVACLNFSSRTEKTYEEVAIGEPIERTRTINVSDLVIASVAPTDLTDGDVDSADLQACLAKRTARIEAAKEKSAAKKNADRNKSTEKAKANLGF